MLRVAVETDAEMIYSDHYSVENGVTVAHPVIDYQAGSLRDDFDFGSVIVIKAKTLKEYAAAKRAEATAANAGSAAKEGTAGIKSIGQKLADFKDKLFEQAAKHPQLFLAVGAVMLLFMMVSSALSSCSAFLPGSSSAVVATTFTAKDKDIIGANDDYKALEAALQKKIDNIESTCPGYDQYNYYLDEIGHDPYQLTAYLTVLFEDYSRSEVQPTLQTLFDLQYELKIEKTVSRKRKILNVTLAQSKTPCLWNICRAKNSGMSSPSPAA